MEREKPAKGQRWNLQFIDDANPRPVLHVITEVTSDRVYFHGGGWDTMEDFTTDSCDMRYVFLGYAPGFGPPVPTRGAEKEENSGAHAILEGDISTEDTAPVAASRDSVPRCGHRSNAYGLLCTRDQGHDGNHRRSEWQNSAEWPRDPEVIKLRPAGGHDFSDKYATMVALVGGKKAIGVVCRDCGSEEGDAGKCVSKNWRRNNDRLDQQLSENLPANEEARLRLREMANPTRPAQPISHQSHSTAFGGIFSLRASPGESDRG